MSEASDASGDEKARAGWTWRSWALLAAHGAALVAMAYALAYDEISGSWAAFLALPIWAALVAGAVATLLFAKRLLPTAVRAGLVLVALGALPIANAVAPALEPLARVHRQIRMADRSAAHESLVQRHCRELSETLDGPRRVVDTAGWFVIVEGGYGLELVGVQAREDLPDRLADRLVERTVMVRVAPDCPHRYTPDGASALLYDRGLVSDGRGHRYGAVPAYLWSDTILWNRTFARPFAREHLNPPPRPSGRR